MENLLEPTQRIHLDRVHRNLSRSNHLARDSPCRTELHNGEVSTMARKFSPATFQV